MYISLVMLYVTVQEDRSSAETHSKSKDGFKRKDLSEGHHEILIHI